MCSFPVCLIVECLIQTPFHYFQVEDKLFLAVLLLRAKELLKKKAATSFCFQEKSPGVTAGIQQSHQLCP